MPRIGRWEENAAKSGSPLHVRGALDRHRTFEDSTAWRILRQVATVIVVALIALSFASAGVGVGQLGTSGSAALHAQSDPVHLAHLPFVAKGKKFAKIPKTTEWDFVLGGAARAVDIVDGFAYVGVGAHLVVYDVSELGSMDLIGGSTPLSGAVSDVVVRDGLAYVAVNPLRSVDWEDGGLFVLDVRDPTNVVTLGRGEIDGGATRLAIEGDDVVLVSQGDVSGRFTGLHHFDVSDPRRPALVGQYSMDWRGRLDVALVAGVAYTCQADGGGLTVIDLSERSAEPSEDDGWACGALAATADGTALVIAGARYPLGPTLRLYDISEDPKSPRLLAETPSIEAMGPSYVHITDVTIVDDRALVTGWNSESGWRMEADVADPTTLRVIDAIPMSAAGLGIDAIRDQVITVGATDGFNDFESVRGWLGDEYDAVAFGSRIAVFARSLPPEPIDAIRVEDIKNLHEQTLTILSASSAGVFLAHSTGSISWYRIQDDRLIPAGVVGADVVAFDSQDEYLYTIDTEGTMTTFDVSGPDTHPSVGSVETGVHGEAIITIGDGVMWIAAVSNEADVSREVVQVDITDPKRPSVEDRRVLDVEGGFGITALSAVGRMVYVVASSEEWLTELHVLRAAPPGGSIEVIETWEARDTDVYQYPIPFVMAVGDREAWFAGHSLSRGSESIHGSFVTLSLRNLSAPFITGLPRPPAASVTRRTDRFDDISDTRAPVGILFSDSHLIGTFLQGGFFGVDRAH